MPSSLSAEDRKTLRSFIRGARSEGASKKTLDRPRAKPTKKQRDSYNKSRAKKELKQKLNKHYQYKEMMRGLKWKDSLGQSIGSRRA